METKHTVMPHSELPWRVDKTGDIVAQDNMYIANMDIPERHGVHNFNNAEYIVRCVNAHDELIAELEKCVGEFCAIGFTMKYDNTEALKSIRAALAKARGE